MAETIDYLRHGESEDLTLGIRSRQDTSLTEKGREEARQAALAMKESGMSFDLILASPLLRAQQSAGEVARVLGYPVEDIETMLDLREREWGIGEGMHNEEIKKRWEGNFDKVPYAESEGELEYRARLLYQRLLERPEPRILIVAHGTLGRKLRQVAAENEGQAGKVPDFNDESGKMKTGGVIRLYQRRPPQHV